MTPGQNKIAGLFEWDLCAPKVVRKEGGVRLRIGDMARIMHLVKKVARLDLMNSIGGVAFVWAGGVFSESVGSFFRDFESSISRKAYTYFSIMIVSINAFENVGIILTQAVADAVPKTV